MQRILLVTALAVLVAGCAGNVPRGDAVPAANATSGPAATASAPAAPAADTVAAAPKKPKLSCVQE